MCKRRTVLLVALTVLCVVAAGGTVAVTSGSDAALPETASGTFIQRKTLADVDVTITSTGTFRFEKGLRVAYIEAASLHVHRNAHELRDYGERKDHHAQSQKQRG